jgi:hypothetical protein
MARHRDRGNDRSKHGHCDVDQAVADALFRMPKVIMPNESKVIFQPGMKRVVTYQSEDKHETFRISIARPGQTITKASYQLMTSGSVILRRLDIGAAPHWNPGFILIPCPHLHIYKHGFGDQVAELITDEFGDTGDLAGCLQRFLTYCGVKAPLTLDEREQWF